MIRYAEINYWSRRLRRVEVGDTEGARLEMSAHLKNAAKDIEAVLGEGALDREPRGREDV